MYNKSDIMNFFFLKKKEKKKALKSWREEYIELLIDS